ncbi:MAG: outer membrane lipoprotein carrier protein LolA [Thermoanaerobaculia bacterium]
MMRLNFTAHSLLLLVTIGLSAQVDADSLPHPRSPDLGPAARLQALLERTRLEQEKLVTLVADFVQHKESAMLIEPETSTGMFSYAAPDRVRWEYASPNPISLLIEKGKMTIWLRDLDQVEEVQVGKQSQRILKYLGASSSLKQLLEYFEVALSLPDDASLPYRLDLSPRYERIAKRLSEMKIWIDPNNFLPTRLRYVEADGDVTEYEFSNLQINTDIPPTRFVLDLPADLRVRTVGIEDLSGTR